MTDKKIYDRKEDVKIWKYKRVYRLEKDNHKELKEVIKIKLMFR